VAFAERRQREPDAGASDESLQQRAAANGKDGCVTHGGLLVVTCLESRSLLD
jgi:hypothetical protein